MIFDGEKERRSVDETYDYVIIGSGAAGATAARVLADTGASIAVVEEGPAVDTKDFGDKVFPAFKKMVRNMGATIARGRAFIPVVQGSCLGGSTVINSAIIWRIPEDVWTVWDKSHGLGQALPLDRLHQHWDVIERELNIHPVERDVWGNHNRLMDVARERMDVGAKVISRGDKGCKGSARCLTGCPHGAKQSMLVSYLPYASERGTTLYTSARVDRVELKGDRAVAVHGHFHVPQYLKNIAKFTLRARKAVVLAASAIQTPGLLRKSGIRNRRVGMHFQGHPGSPLMGIWNDPVNMWFGATQGYDADHHRIDGRTKIETISLPPEIAFARMPGVGARWLETMAETPYGAIWAVQLRSFAEGYVGNNGMFGTDIRFDLTDRDMDNLRKGLKFNADMMFAAGAQEVILGIYGMPERLTRPEDTRLILEGPADPAAYSWIVSHLFGTARMSNRPEDGVVGPDFAVHGTKNFYVVDSSVFPTNMGVNPQHAIMGVAMHGAHGIATRHQ
jgi:choline dehydrogenase-like flavoprotein